MAVTFGFYNSVRGDRVYNAEQMSSIFSGIIKDGVFENYPASGQHLVCSEGPGLSMIVGPGRAWFNDTWTNNDSPLLLTFDEPDNQNDRIDTIVLEINKTNSPHTVNAGSSTYVVEGRSNKFVVVKGTPASDPVRPTLIRENGIYQYSIAIVRISPSTPDKIKSYYNTVGLSEYTPFIIGAVQSVSAENVLDVWKNEVDRKIQNELNSYLNDDGSKLYEKIKDSATNIVYFHMYYQGNVSCSHSYQQIRQLVSDRIPIIAVLEVDDLDRIYYGSLRTEIERRTEGTNAGLVEFNFLADIESGLVFRCGYDGLDPDPFADTKYLNPLLVSFETDSEGVSSCSRTFQEIRSAVILRRSIEAYFKTPTNTTIGPATVTLEYNSSGALSSFAASISNMQPHGPNIEDWKWVCESYVYTASELTHNADSH